MNCISSLNVRMLLPLVLAVAACNAQVSGPLAPSDPLRYRVDYIVRPVPAEGAVDVTLRLSQSSALLRKLTMRPDSRVTGISADGELQVGATEVSWSPPASGGSISWRVAVANRRNGQGYDAWLGVDFGLFRAEDIIPRGATRTLKGARSETWLTLQLPATWSAVTQYYSDKGRILVDNPQRRFDQPSGWIVMGDLGVRRERIGEMRVAIAGPVDHSIRRMDTLALLNWTLPELARLLPELPPRLTIVSAGDPMWRGGLSAPQSLFLHAERPLISENATSTVLHEIMHMSLGLKARDGYDWIVEGLAEYYSLQLLQRSGTISQVRYDAARADLAEWAKTAATLCGKTSTGATTALAVGVLAALDAELVKLSHGEASLDDVTRELWQLDAAIDADTLADIAKRLGGSKLDALRSAQLRGCHTTAAERPKS